MSPKTVNPETRLLSAQVRMNDPKAIKRIIVELKKAKGDVAATAVALGIGERTLYLWRDVSEDLAKAFGEHVRSVGRQPLPKKKLTKTKA